jgi:hypothetical protein
MVAGSDDSKSFGPAAQLEVALPIGEAGDR